MKQVGSINCIIVHNMYQWGGVDPFRSFITPLWQSDERSAPCSAFFIFGGDREDRSIG